MLDLFAGVGTIGLEAVSRGATDVVMVEQDRRISSILRFNVEELGCGDRATVVQADAFGPAALQRPAMCDIVFLDLPYPLWRDEATRGRVLDLAKRCRAVMKAKSFLVLRLPEPFEGTLEGVRGTRDARLRRGHVRPSLHARGRVGRVNRPRELAAVSVGA